MAESVYANVIQLIAWVVIPITTLGHQVLAAGDLSTEQTLLC